MRMPERFKAGETLKKDIGPKLNALVEFVKSLVPHGDGKTVLVRHTDNGTFFSAKTRGGGPGGGSSDAQQPVPAVVTGGTTLDGYTVDFYANGFDKTATAEDQPCHVMDLAAYDNIPAGERVMALPITVTETGDAE